MPSKIVIDEITNLLDSGRLSLSSQVVMDGTELSHIQLPTSLVEIPEENGTIRWNPTTNTLEYYNGNSWVALILEEDYDNIIKIGSVIYLDTKDNFSQFAENNSWNNITNYFSIGVLNNSGVFFEVEDDAFSFNSTSHYFTIGSDFTTQVMKPGTSSSYSFWFKSDPSLNYGSGAGDKILFSVNQDVDGTNSVAILTIGINPNGGIYYDDDSITATTVGSTNYNDNQWHNLVITRPEGTGGQTSTFYIDGVSIGTLSGTNPSYDLGSIVLLGARTQNTDVNNIISFYGGLLSFVMVQEIELTAAQVLENYNEFSYRY